jgi:hypothetical protein
VAAETEVVAGSRGSEIGNAFEDGVEISAGPPTAERDATNRASREYVFMHVDQARRNVQRRHINCLRASEEGIPLATKGDPVACDRYIRQRRDAIFRVNDMAAF